MLTSASFFFFAMGQLDGEKKIADQREQPTNSPSDPRAKRDSPTTLPPHADAQASRRRVFGRRRASLGGGRTSLIMTLQGPSTILRPGGGSTAGRPEHRGVPREPDCRLDIACRHSRPRAPALLRRLPPFVVTAMKLINALRDRPTPAFPAALDNIVRAPSASSTSGSPARTEAGAAREARQVIWGCGG